MTNEQLMEELYKLRQSCRMGEISYEILTHGILILHIYERQFSEKKGLEEIKE